MEVVKGDLMANTQAILDEEVPVQPLDFGKKRKQKWLHDPKELLYGSVVFRGKHLGIVEVTESNGRHVVRDAMKKLKHSMETGKQPTPEVDIAVSVRSIIVTEVKSKMHVCKHKLQRITFCGEDKEGGDNVFAYIVKGKISQNFLCFCFETQNRSRTVSLTVGQAFHLAYERFLEAKKASEEFVRERKKMTEKKEREDAAKKLEELLTAPSSDKQLGKRHVMKMSPSFLEKWETLTEVLEPFSNKPIAQNPSSTNDIDKALAEIESQLKELEFLQNDYQKVADDALQAIDELDSALFSNPLDSDSTSNLAESHSPVTGEDIDEITAL